MFVPVSKADPGHLRARKKVQPALTSAAATTGLGSLVALGAGAALTRGKKPNLVRTGEKLKRASMSVGITSAGVGGIGGLNSASIQRQENKRNKITKGAVERAQRRRKVARPVEAVGEAGGAAAAGLAGGALIRDAFLRDTPKKARYLSVKTAHMHPVVRAAATKPAGAKLIATGLLLGAAGKGAQHVRNKADKKIERYGVRKDDRKKAAVGAAAGTAGGYGAWKATGAVATFGNRFKYKPGGVKDAIKGVDDRPDGQKPTRAGRLKLATQQRHKLTNSQQKAMKAHKKAHGIPSTGFDPNIPGKTYVKFNRTLPKDIPGTRVPRVLAHTHGGKAGKAIGLTTALVAGTVGAASSQKKVKKAYSPERNRQKRQKAYSQAAGAAAGAALGYGAAEAGHAGSLLATGAKIQRRSRLYNAAAKGFREKSDSAGAAASAARAQKKRATGHDSAAVRNLRRSQRADARSTQLTAQANRMRVAGKVSLKRGAKGLAVGAGLAAAASLNEAHRRGSGKKYKSWYD